jgi:hypothetical protein
MVNFKTLTAIILLNCSFAAQACSDHPNYNMNVGAVNEGTQNWKSFVLHVREGKVDELVQSAKCKGNGATAGCARWRPASKGAWLDGECWITVPKWEIGNLFITLYMWGHEVAHCVKGSWHE